MKITIENIAKEYPKIDIPLPEPLAKEKFEKLKTTFLPNYDKSEVIKKMVDTFVLKLNKVIAKAPKPKQEAAPKPKAEKPKAPKAAKAKRAKKVTKPKPAAKPKKAAPKKVACNAKATVQKVESFPEDVRLIRRFQATVGKERQRRTILNIYRDMERRITERKVNVNSSQAALIQEISKKLKATLDTMSKRGLTHAVIAPSDESKAFFDKVEAVARGKEIRASVNLLKRFIGIEGEASPDKAKVKRLADAFESALKRGKICDSDLYFTEFKEANAGMKAFLEGKAKRISISPTGLRGIEKITCLGKPKATAIEKPVTSGSGVNGLVSNFNAAIKRFFTSSKSKDNIYSLGKPKKLLKGLGMPDKEIILRKSRLKEKVEKHGLTFEHLKNLPNQINSPILVFKYEKGRETFNVFVSKTNKEGLLMCGINTGKQKVNKMEVSEIITIHGRNCNQLISWVQKGLLLYAGDIAKIKKLLSDSGINCLQSEQLLNIINTKLNNPNEKSKLSGIEPEPVIVTRFQVDISKPVPEPVVEPMEEPRKDPALDGLFTPITYNAPESTHNKIDLPGDLGRFLGYVERYEYSILLRGEKGAGKTRMLYQMMNTFARAGFKVGCFSLEIGKQSNLIRDMRNQYISPTIANSVFIADNVPNGLEDIRAAARQFDVVCIDSWGKIPGTKADDFDRLRKEFPKTMFVIIFQSTTNGTARGGSMPEYDAGIVIQVNEGGRAYCEKNRYNGEDLTYLVFQRKLEEPEPVPAV